VAIGHLLVVANDDDSNFVNGWGVVSMLVLFRIGDDANSEITETLLSKNVVRIKENAREWVAVT
jgi:hypothetical protein